MSLAGHVQVPDNEKYQKRNLHCTFHSSEMSAYNKDNNKYKHALREIFWRSNKNEISTKAKNNTLSLSKSFSVILRTVSHTIGF